MSNIWPHATTQNPCPICGKTDWCSFGDKAMLCRRVESTHACPTGGWYHFYDKPNPDFIPRAQRRFAPIPTLNVTKLFTEWQSLTRVEQRHGIAASLGITPYSLQEICACWAWQYKAWAFPMRDGEGRAVGIRLRSTSGFKWSVKGSKNGCFYREPEEEQQVAYLPEGPTDTAALLSLGLFAIGRPNCNSGNEIVQAVLHRLGIRRAVVIADNDEAKDMNGNMVRPGVEGALRLKRELGVKSVIWSPPNPLKDVRQFVQAGGTREMIESQLRNKSWTVK